MTNEAIRPGGHQLMVGGEARVETPLPPERTRSGPGKKRGEHQENDAKRQAPGPQLHFPEVPLPHDSVTHSDKNDSPSSALVQLFRRLFLFMDKKKRQHPQDPTGGQNGESV